MTKDVFLPLNLFIGILISFVFICSPTLTAQNCGIIPTPQDVQYQDGTFIFDQSTNIFIHHTDSNKLFIAKQLQEEVEKWSNQNIHIIDSTFFKNKNYKKEVEKKFNTIYLFQDEQWSDNAEKYQIRISTDKIEITACNEKGLFYAIQSLKQLYRFFYSSTSSASLIPCMTITDYPAMRYRGWMDDISRGPIPTLEFLKKEIRTLAEFKLNFFNLYTEHTFKLSLYPDIAPGDGLTPEEIHELEVYANQYYIELFANQQCFAHAEHILSNPFFSGMADTKYNYNPGVEETYQFLEIQLGEVAKAYKSPFFNINCDETDGLGNGLAKAYVNKVGSTTAYCEHINKVYNILQKNNKRVIMWGDIITQHPEMISQLPKDIIMNLWSYVDADNFNGMIKPFTESGSTFMVAPGVSMWGTIFPSVPTYTKNIANLVRDGYQNGAIGMMNTAWDDNGEPLFNSAWHALIWGAEMAWNPIQSTITQEADLERTKRLELFNLNFNYQFFHYFHHDVIIADILNLFSSLEEFNQLNLLGFNALWEPITHFYPTNTAPELIELNRKTANEMRNGFSQWNYYNTNLKEVIDNHEILDIAQLAWERIFYTTQRNLLRAELWSSYKNGKNDSIQYFGANIENLYNLKKQYTKLWDLENRAHYRSNILSRYDNLANELLNIDQYIMIETKLSKDYHPLITLSTLNNTYPIFYTLDGSEPTNRSTLYREPLTIAHSCLIKAKSISELGAGETIERSVLYHKGIGRLHRLNSHYSTYRAEYSAGGDMGLLDGITGSNNFSDGKWQGYQGTDIDIEINFNQSTDINSITTHFLQNTPNWILAPKEIEIYTSKSANGKYQLVRTENYTFDQKYSGNIILPISIENLNLHTQYLRIVIKNPGTLPDWHSCKGSPSYLFIDEIVIQ